MFLGIGNFVPSSFGYNFAQLNYKILRGVFYDTSKRLY